MDSDLSNQESEGNQMCNKSKWRWKKIGPGTKMESMF